MVICLERGADLHMAQLMPLPLTVSCFCKIQVGFTFLVPAHPGSPGQKAAKRVCVCVCMFVCLRAYLWNKRLIFTNFLYMLPMNVVYRPLLALQYVVLFVLLTSLLCSIHTAYFFMMCPLFLLVPAYPGCPGSKAVKRSLLLLYVPLDSH